MWMAHGPRRLQHCNIKPYDPIDSVEFVCGYNLDGKIHSIPKVQRVLLAGGSGSGKTNSIQLNLVSWHVWYTPDQLRLVLISTDGASLGGFQDSKMLFTPDLFCDEVDTYLPTLKRVLDIRERRRRAFKQAGINTLAQWNACNPRKRLPFIMVVIEEMSDSADEVDALIEQLEDEDPQYKPEFKNANAPVIRLAEVARKQGIGIVIGTQRPAAKSVDPRIKANVDLRAVYRVGSEADSAIAFGIKNENRGFYLQGDGDSFILHKAQFERCQQFLMGATEEEAQHYIKEMVKYHNYQYRDAIPDPDDRFLPPLPQKEDPVRQRYNQYLSLLDKGLSETEVFRQIFSSRYPDEQITGNSLKWCRTQIAKWEETYAEE
jgi:DNA segregation ATPase FtsK/SpoIIIE-like protein